MEARNISVLWTPRFALLLMIVLLLWVIGPHLLPFMSGVLGALTIYMLLRNQMRSLVERHHWRRTWATLTLLLEATIIFLIPLIAAVLMLIDVFSDFNPQSLLVLSEHTRDFIGQLEHKFGIELWEPNNIRQLTQMSTELVKSLVEGFSSFMMNLVVILLLLYFMLHSYDRFETAVRELLPFTQENKNLVMNEIVSLVRSNAIGIPLLGLIQGIVAYVGYLIFGVDNALLYAVLTAFSTVIPLLGTMLVWIPLAIVLGINGSWLNAILLGAYGFIVIGGADNIVRFLMQKRMADTHPLITIFGVLVGVPLFGFWGVIFGPLLLSLLILFVNLYRRDFIPGSKVTLKGVPSDSSGTRNLKRLSRVVSGGRRLKQLKDAPPTKQEQSPTSAH